MSQTDATNHTFFRFSYVFKKSIGKKYLNRKFIGSHQVKEIRLQMQNTGEIINCTIAVHCEF